MTESTLADITRTSATRMHRGGTRRAIACRISGGLQCGIRRRSLSEGVAQRVGGGLQRIDHRAIAWPRASQFRQSIDTGAERRRPLPCRGPARLFERGHRAQQHRV
jgi:hypothetical protein